MHSELTIPFQLAAQAERIPNSTAILSPGSNPLSYSALQIHLEQTVKDLNGFGVSPNDRIAIVLPNGPEMAVCVLAVSACGTSVPLNPAYRAAEFDDYMSRLNIKALIIQANLDSAARTVAKERGVPIIDLTPVDGEGNGLFRLQADRSRHGLDRVLAKAEDVAVILHTSGVTGLPKIVPLSHANICRSAKNIREALDLVEKDRCLNVMPLFHAHGLIIAVISSLLAGSSVVCPRGFDAERFFEWMNTFHPTWYTAAPTIHQAILENSAQHREIIIRSPFRFIRSSAAPLSPKVAEGLEKSFHAPVIEGFGMTECVQITSNPLPPRKAKLGSVGLGAGPKVAVMDGLNQLLPTGEIGEIVIQGNTVTTGYENVATQSDSAADAWFRTGDQGYLDFDGYLFITGRLKEMINCGGEKIAPREIDDVLVGHPAVAQAITFAIPHPTLGEDVAAAIVLHKNTSVTEKELREFASRRLADFKVPRQIVFVGEVPKAATGKPLRLDLAEHLGLKGTVVPQSIYSSLETRDQTPEMLTAIWKQLLNVSHVNVQDNFFRLGGDSILATQLLSRIRKEFHVELPLRSLFEAPTFVELSKAVDQAIQTRSAFPSATPVSVAPRANSFSNSASEGLKPSGSVPAVATVPLATDKGLKPEKDIQFSLFFFSADGSTRSRDKYRLVIEGAKFADRHRYAAVWTPERHFHAFGGLYPNPSVLAAAIAMVTDRIQIRSASVVLPLQNPIRVAEEWSVVDNLSNGRVEVSFASGWQVNDFVLWPENYANRKQRMLEGIQTVQDLWQGNPITLVNGAGNEVAVRIFPIPLQQNLPIWLSCQSNETFTKAGEIGANVVTSMFLMPVEELAGKIKLYREARAKYGHDPEKGKVAVNMHTFIGDDLETLKEKVKVAYVDYLLVNLGLHQKQATGSGAEFDPSESDKEFITTKAVERLFNERGLVGTLSMCRPKVDALRAAGVNEIACLIDFGIDTDSVMASLYQLNKLKELYSNEQTVGASSV